MITYPRKCLEAEMVALNGLDLVTPGIPSITVHNESHVARDGALLQGADKSFAESLDGPFCRGRTEEPVSNAGEIEIRHDAELPHTQGPGDAVMRSGRSVIEYGRGIEKTRAWRPEVGRDQPPKGPRMEGLKWKFKLKLRGNFFWGL